MRSVAGLQPWIPREDAWRRLAENVEDLAIILLDPGGRVSSWNRGAEKLKGYTAEEIIGKSFKLFYPDEAVEVGHPERELEAAASIGRYEEHGWRVRKDGSRFWAHVVLTAIYDEQGDLEGFGKLTRDLTLVKQAEEQRIKAISLLEATAATDFLTGLPNRRAWDDALQRELLSAVRDGGTVWVAVIDIDRFKELNDELGHHEGDRFLKRCAVVWRATLGPTDFLARYGGEEFVLCLPECDAEQAREVIDRLRAVTPTQRTCSAGLAVWDHTESIDSLFARADRGLYQAKERGRNETVIASAALPGTARPALIEHRTDDAA